MYRIEWDEDVLRRFTQQFDRLEKTDQSPVMDALDATDRLLVMKPMEVGESRATASQRVLIVPPVLLVFHVAPRLQIVTIVDAQIL